MPARRRTPPAVVAPLVLATGAAVAFAWMAARDFDGGETSSAVPTRSLNRPIVAAAAPALVAAVVPGEPAPGPAVFAEHSLRVETADGKVTIDAVDVPLGRVLAELAEALGAEAWMDPGSVSRQVTLAFDGLDLEPALETIASPLNYSVTWRRAASRDRSHPARIVVYRQGHAADATRIAAATADGGAVSPRTGMVPDEILVRLGRGEPTARAEEIARLYDAEIVGAIPALGVVRLRFAADRDPRELAAELARAPGVDLAEPNYYIEPIPDLVVRGLEADLPTAWEALARPGAVTVSDGQVAAALLDTGVDGSFPALDGLLLTGYDFVAASPAGDLDHGTAMAHVLAGQFLAGDGGEATAVPVVPVRILGDGDDPGTYFDAAEGILYAADSGVRVINMSWGGPAASDLLDTALAYAADRGAVLVAAAGNDGTGEPLAPASHPLVLGVSAVQADGSWYEFSNYGDHVEFAATGDAIFADDEPGRFIVVRGTSVASAAVANSIATILARNPQWTAADVTAHLRSIAVDGGDPGPDPRFGYGIVPVGGTGP